ncbi:hypothetical protein [Methylopila sp. M107]|uniref:hypothetical protein n=1 Tax=Methylopila sp. M107 TaxID=1101190 RepID=UPI00037B1B00|nr:hypothetical protein [Methylopila sp. M107]
MLFDRLVLLARDLLRIGVAGVLVALAVLLLAKYLSGPFVDHVLANAVRTEERKLPPTVTNYRVGSDDVEIVGGMGQGLSCSLPGFVERLGFSRDDKTASISLQMRQACVHHDLCYRHGAATYGYGQVDCDILLQQNAFKLCTQIGSSETSVTQCESEARKIALGVLLGGFDSFRRADSSPSDSRPNCAYCKYLKVWNIWRKEYWSGAATAWDDRSSTYYEFDGHPQRSNEFISVRIADAPANWRDAAPKAYYVFRTRPSGIQLRILGLRKDGGRLCAAYALGGDFRFRSSLAVVARMTGRETGVPEDWFVWMRQNETSRPETAFSGLAPGRATAADWGRVFGSVRDITQDALCDGDREGVSTETAAASFVDVKARDPRGGLRFVGLNAIYPDIPSSDAPADAGAITLFGLTDRICALDEDRSSCVVRIRIKPEFDATMVEREPFKPREPNCVGAPTDEHCDAYRNFVLPPRVVRTDAAAGLAWTRRGASNGEGYSQNAVLRWGPARNPTELAPIYPQTPVQRMKESYEPTAWTATDPQGRQGFVSIVPSAACGGLKIVHFVLAPKTSDAGPSVRSTRCLAGLDGSWLSRPWRLVGGRKVLMFRIQFIEREVCKSKPGGGGCEDHPWPRSKLEIAEFDVDLDAAVTDRPDRADRAKMTKVKKSEAMTAQNFCLVTPESKASRPSIKITNKHFATSRGCSDNKQAETGVQVGVEEEQSATELDYEARLRDISSLINRAPLIVGDIDGDGVPEVALLSLAFDEVVLFQKPKGVDTWRRVEPTTGRL